jgi:Sec-independent protein translocase protein TatA
MGVGWQEIIVIIVAFFAFFKGENARDAARWFGKTTKELRLAWDDLKNDIIIQEKKSVKKKRMAG